MSSMGKAPNGSMAPSWTLNFTPFPLRAWTSFVQHWVSTGQNSHLNPSKDWNASWLASILFSLFVTPNMTQQKKETRKHTGLMETGMESVLYVSLHTHDWKTRHLAANCDVKVGFVALEFTGGKNKLLRHSFGGDVSITLQRKLYNQTCSLIARQYLFSLSPST